MPVAIAATVPVLVVRLGVTFLRMKSMRRRAVRRFRHALVQGGMSAELAQRLTTDYESLGRLRTYFPKRWRPPGFPISR